MRRALVTGNCGFLGRHFYTRLLQEGYTVTGADLVGPLRTDALEVFHLDRRRYDLVIHCAAHAPNRKAIDGQPHLVGSSNLELDAALFRWAAQTQPDQLVYISSSAVYPVSLQMGSVNVPLQEDVVRATAPTLSAPDAVYGWTKLTGELMAEHYRAAGGRVLVVRPFSGYGSDQSGEFPFGAFRDRALERADPFDVWGSGEQVRDFIHVDDIVNAVLALVQTETAEPVNLATGLGTSMLQLAGLFCEAAGYDPWIRVVENAPAGVDYRVGDSIRLRSVYQPQVSIEQGVARALERRM